MYSENRELLKEMYEDISSDLSEHEKKLSVIRQILAREVELVDAKRALVDSLERMIELGERYGDKTRNNPKSEKGE